MGMGLKPALVVRAVTAVTAVTAATIRCSTVVEATVVAVGLADLSAVRAAPTVLMA